jgi:hypothetical protein
MLVVMVITRRVSMKKRKKLLHAARAMRGALWKKYGDLDVTEWVAEARQGLK